MSTAPAEAPLDSESPSDKSGTQPELVPPAESRRRRWQFFSALAAAGIVVILLLLFLLRSRTPSSAALQQPLSSRANPVLRLKGTTEAVQARAILAPQLAGEHVSSLTIVQLTPGGARVKRGDVLVEFDRQAQLRDYVDKKADYEKLVDQVAEEQAKEVAAKAKDETELTTAEDSLRKAELENEKAEIVSKIDAEKNQETYEEAKATYNQLKETFDLKRKAAQAAIRILEIQRDRTKQIMDHAQANADLMQIHSPLDGVVVLNTIWKQGTMGEVQEGDQVRPGVAFMQVVDPSTMQVRVLANQEDFPALRAGQTAKIRLDAYPDMVFSGNLDQLAPIGENGDFSSKLRTFVVIFSIQGNNRKLMPDLSAAVDVDISGQKTASQGTGQAGGGS
ncbi:MAG TPA: efflux RND transporter periplasmic adaptor subunit [Candidatus Acidoferrales bacterium]|nr:efflux RND transporter periplasmic adaptor subunit [Candidatus Acidoferrales bacterium]